MNCPLSKDNIARARHRPTPRRSPRTDRSVDLQSTRQGGRARSSGTLPGGNIMLDSIMIMGIITPHEVPRPRRRDAAPAQPVGPRGRRVGRPLGAPPGRQDPAHARVGATCERPLYAGRPVGGVRAEAILRRFPLLGAGWFRRVGVPGLAHALASAGPSSGACRVAGSPRHRRTSVPGGREPGVAQRPARVHRSRGPHGQALRRSRGVFAAHDAGIPARSDISALRPRQRGLRASPPAGRVHREGAGDGPSDAIRLRRGRLGAGFRATGSWRSRSGWTRTRRSTPSSWTRTARCTRNRIACWWRNFPRPPVCDLSSTLSEAVPIVSQRSRVGSGCPPPRLPAS